MSNVIKYRQYLKELAEISILTAKLHDDDANKAINWVSTPNSCFFNKTPVEVVFSGEGEAVIGFLKERLGK